MSSECTSLRFEGARGQERTIGRSVRTRIRARRRVEETQGGSTTAERRVQNSARGRVRRVMCANTLMESSNAGCIHRDIARNCARMALRAIVVPAFSHTTRRSCACRRTPMEIQLATCRRTRRRQREAVHRRARLDNRVHLLIGDSEVVRATAYRIAWLQLF